MSKFVLILALSADYAAHAADAKKQDPAHVVATAHDHAHGEKCGHKAVAHADHKDYVHDGHYHAAHGDHVDEHGTVP